MPIPADAFREEAYELLSELESSLLELLESPENTDLVGRVFRAMHTIKGSGAMFGFEGIASFTHELETAFDLVRSGRLKVNRELVDLTLAGRDFILSLLDSGEPSFSGDQQERERIVGGLRQLSLWDVEADAATVEALTATPAGVDPQKVQEAIYRIRFKPGPGILRMGTNPILLLNELRELGRGIIVAQNSAIPSLDEMDAELCYTYWDVILSTGCGMGAIRDVFLFVEDESEISIDVIDDGSDLAEDADYKKLGDILVERNDITQEEVRAVLMAQKRFGEILVSRGLLPAEKVESALLEQHAVRDLKEKRRAEERATSVRVPSQKLDTLVDLVGELVTMQARLSRTAQQLSDPSLLAVSEEVERLTVELRDNTMSIRMLPIGTTFSKFKRLVHDLSCDLGKEIVLTLEGEETELDKTVIERLGDPLVHLVRNSVDHGIEPPAVRESAGKPRHGTIHLSAMHSGASVLIQIRDDGKGMDTASIRAKAVETGLIAPEADLSEKELFALVFAPGFSTARAVTSVSGRGVGMDVVKRNIDALGGTIEITSARGAGTTVTLKLPLTLAIIEGLLVDVGDSFYVLPLSLVEECVELTAQDVARSHRKPLAVVRGELVPYIRLRDYFGIEGERPSIEQVVISEVDGFRLGFVVDLIVGEHQTVIKSLGKIYRSVEGVSGATILGDGTVALILDIVKLANQVRDDEERLLLQSGRH